MKMPLEGIFIEPSSTPHPDLSLNISPPNTSSSSNICNTSNDPGAHTELSLGRNCRGRAEEPPQNPYQQQSNHHLLHHQYSNNHTLNHINHGVSLLDVSSDGLRPIKGIPVYHSRSFPFLPMDHTREKDPKMCFYQIPSYPSLSSSSASHSASPYYGGPGLDPMSIMSTARFNGLATDAFKSNQLHHHHHHNQYGIGASDPPSHGMMRSRFLPKLPTKRSMRAPRMRWTSTLHARFVHAVELLGGHESKYFLLFLLICL
jgi:hypothetical protein